MKQETLEEAAERYAESNQYDLGYYDEGGFQGIDVNSFAEKLVDFTNKWQQERSYNEEDMQVAWNSSEQNTRLQFGGSWYKNISFEKWLDRFKVLKSARTS